MTDFRKRQHDQPDEQRTRSLSELYAAPSEERYLRGLEALIVSLLAAPIPPSIGWGDELDDWVRPALVAAAVVLAAAGVAVFRQHQVEQQAAYEAMLTSAPSALPVETAVRPVLQEQHETTFRYLMTP